MNETKLYAPELDSIIKRFDPRNNPITPEMYQKLSEIYDIFSFIKPGKEDDIRHTWLEVERDLKIFIDWLHGRITSEINKLRENPHEYNDNIKRNLSWAKRYGRIRRMEFWNILGDEAIRVDLNLGEEKIQTLREIVGKMQKGSGTGLEKMTANEFFRICEICYDANDYFKDKKTALTPPEKYLAMSDGRDAGLRNIPGDSQEEFYKWYHSEEKFGAHPWEICRGGNSTHISLFVSETGNHWKISLEGSSIGRVEETVRMAVALHEKRVPFELYDAEEILNMVTGNDFIGIVPDNVFPRYCHSLFPKEDRIIDFMNLKFLDEFVPEIIDKAFWYPLEEIVPGAT
jgi:hypothetical protein